nr:amidohydrolase family protein [Cupriavidus oxalaticus]
MVDELWGFNANGVPQPCALLPGGGWRSLSPLGIAASLQYPERFGFIQRIELDDPLLLSRIPLLADMPGCRSLRINLHTEADRRRLESGAWDQALALAQRHGLPVSVMTEDAGRLLSPVAQRFEALALVVDHCGWPRSPQHWHEVLELARLPNVLLKWSHAHRAFRRHAQPHQARQRALVDAVQAFGADRVMWAGDVSFEESNASWSELLSFVRDHPGLSEDDRAGVLGRTARRAYRWEI